jgi:hypothetical protein
MADESLRFTTNNDGTSNGACTIFVFTVAVMASMQARLSINTRARR